MLQIKLGLISHIKSLLISSKVISSVVSSSFRSLLSASVISLEIVSFLLKIKDFVHILSVSHSNTSIYVAHVTGSTSIFEGSDDHQVALTAAKVSCVNTSNSEFSSSLDALVQSVPELRAN